MNNPFLSEMVDQVRIHVLPTDRFKTYAVSAYIGSPLSEDKVTAHALIPFVLRRGSSQYPDTKQFREKLDDLYGAGFGFDVYKRGDYQIVQFRMDTIQDRFVSDERSLLEESLKFLGEAITRPALENGVFRKDYVEAEKNTVQKRIEAIINDKIRYAAERCIEEMFQDEPYGLLALGKRDELPSITAESLYEAYKQWLKQAVIDIYVVGPVSPEEVRELVRTHFHWNRQADVSYEQKPLRNSERDVKQVVERLDVSQGKLNMGFRTGITYADDAYAAALMFNGIFGAYPHAKLFINVREKASLAYYASSRLDGHKGIMTIQSGIEVANYEKAYAIIIEQLEAMRRGEISDLEWSQTIAMLSNQLREIQDSAYEMIAFDFNNVFSGRTRSTNEIIQEMTQLDRQAVQSIANQVKLDTVYFLRDQKEEA